MTEEPGVRTVAAGVDEDKAEGGLILGAAAMLSKELLLVSVIAVLFVVSVAPRLLSKTRLEVGF